MRVQRTRAREPAKGSTDSRDPLGLVVDVKSGLRGLGVEGEDLKRKEEEERSQTWTRGVNKRGTRGSRSHLLSDVSSKSL